MIAKFIEATDATEFNWGKFALIRFGEKEWAYRSAMNDLPLLATRGWSHHHIYVMDIQTGEGAYFYPHGLASADLNDSHQIWVCPMFEPFLEWLYKQDLTDLEALPSVVNLGKVPTALKGHRRVRKAKATA